MVMKNLKSILDVADGITENAPPGGPMADETTVSEDEVTVEEEEATDEVVAEAEALIAEPELTTVAASASDSDALAKELVDLRKEAEEAKSLAKALMDERDTNAAIAKAEEWKYVPAITPSDFGPMLKTLREIAPEETAAIEKVFDSTNAVMSESAMFTEAGTIGRESSSSFDELNTMALNMVANGEAKDYSAAIQKATAANPALGHKYRDEMTGRR